MTLGFSPAALRFYEDLEDDNTREYFTAHRTVFDREVKAPMEALRDALAPEFGTAKIFRPHRDVRFSTDKSPYKTHLGMVVGDGEGGEGALYAHLSAAGLLVAGGFHVMASDQLLRFRTAVGSEPLVGSLERVLAALTAQGWTVGGETLATAPRGWPRDHPRIGLLRHKSLTASYEHHRPEWLGTPEVVEHLARGWRALAPLNSWLADHVGPATAPRSRPGAR